MAADKLSSLKNICDYKNNIYTAANIKSGIYKTINPIYFMIIY